MMSMLLLTGSCDYQRCLFLEILLCTKIYLNLSTKFYRWCDTKHKTIIAAMYSSGLRVSEVIHSHHDNISRINMTVHVRETKGRIDQFIILSQKNPDLLPCAPPPYESLHDISTTQKNAAYYITNCKTGVFGVNVSLWEHYGCISARSNSCLLHNKNICKYSSCGGRISLCLQKILHITKTTSSVLKSSKQIFLIIIQQVL